METITREEFEERATCWDDVLEMAREFEYEDAYEDSEENK